MPNWIEGTLKLRGESKDLKLFFENAIQPSSCIGIETGKKEDFISYDYRNGYNIIKIKRNAWIEGTRRAFVNEDCYTEFEDGRETICIPIRQAWAFVPENWQDISKKYNLDVRLYGFECGMEFCQELEVISGEITIDNVIKYDNWSWECPMPRMGG
jgi:hypothetical protein